jgi:flagellar hook-length control protein FliK
MELGPLQAPELLIAADPLSRGPPESLRPPGRDRGAGAAAVPFELLLQLLGNRLPVGLPSGKTLPEGAALPSADAGAPDPDMPAAPLDLVAAAAGTPLALPLPPLVAPLGPAPAAAPAAGASGVAAAEIALAAAMRLAFAGPARTPAAPPPTVSSAADTTTAALAATGTDAPAAAPIAAPEAGVAPVETPAELDALLALDPGTRAAAQAAAEPLALRSRAAPEARARAPGATPAERALSVALASADASAQPHTDDTALPRAFDLQASAAEAAASASFKATRPGEPFELILPPASSPTGFASLAPQGTGAAASATAAQPNAQLPAHLGAPVDANAARWHEALASRIHWLVDHQIGEAQIKLNPPELGALDVKISMLDDKTYVQMTAHTSAARDELSQSLPRLRELMSASGLDLGGATVSGGRDDRSGYQAAAQPLESAGPSGSDPADQLADLPHVRPLSTSRIDLFA